MDIVWLFGGVIIGAVIGHVAVRLILGRMERRRRTEMEREAERKAGLWALQREYVGKVDLSILESVAHSPHSVEEVRQILEDSIESLREMDELFGPGGPYQESIRRRWEGLL